MVATKERLVVHTAGKWILESTECGDVAPGEQRHRISVDDRSEIAYLQSYTSPDGDAWGIGRDETEANARLISAAPTMLAALEEAMEFLANGTPIHSGSFVQASIFNAIREAKGST